MALVSQTRTNVVDGKEPIPQASRQPWTAALTASFLKGSPMATSNFSLTVKILFVAAGVTCAIIPEAVAQSQMQGNFVGSAMPPNMGKKPNKQAMRKECEAQGKQKGLKGRELRSYQKDCVDGTLPDPVRDTPPPAAPKTLPEPSATPAK